jgi:hypothetical protein
MDTGYLSLIQKTRKEKVRKNDECMNPKSVDLNSIVQKFFSRINTQFLS